MDHTTIQLRPSTRKKLAELKEFRRESYDEILNKLLSLIPEGDDEGAYRPEFRASILRGLIDGMHNKVYSTDEVKRHLGLVG